MNIFNLDRGYLQCHVYHTDTRESSVGSQYRLAQLGRNTARHPEETGKMEEAAVLEKKTNECFFSFSTKYWKNGRC